MVIIEMNPRVSRSLGPGVEGHGLPSRRRRAWPLGYTLDEIMNDMTGTTPACFEPSTTIVS